MRGRRIRTSLSAALLLLAVAACGADDGGTSGPYAAEVAQAREQGSPFVVEVLEDGTISDAEIAEARSRWERCLADAGIEGEAEVDALGEPSYTLRTDGLEEDAVDRANADCYGSSGLARLDPLEGAMRVNPDRVDVQEATAACLREAGVVPPGFGAQDVTDGALEGLDVPPDVFRRCTTDPLGVAAGG